MGFRLSPAAVDSYLHEVLDKVPNGAAVLISTSLSPVVEALLDAAVEQAIEALEEENHLRKAQGIYLLKRIKASHFQAAMNVFIRGLHKGIMAIENNVAFGGDSSGEEKPPVEPGIRNNKPHRGIP